MKCPYLMMIQVISKFEYDSEGRSTQVITQELQLHKDCIKEDCAAWDKERGCTYNGKG